MTYRSAPVPPGAPVAIAAGLFGPGEVPGLVMPDGYKRSIAAWFTRLNGQAVP